MSADLHRPSQLQQSRELACQRARLPGAVSPPHQPAREPASPHACPPGRPSTASSSLRTTTSGGRHKRHSRSQAAATSRARHTHAQAGCFPLPQPPAPCPLCPHLMPAGAPACCAPASAPSSPCAHPGCLTSAPPPRRRRHSDLPVPTAAMGGQGRRQVRGSRGVQTSHKASHHLGAQQTTAAVKNHTRAVPLRQRWLALHLPLPAPFTPLARTAEPPAQPRPPPSALLPPRPSPCTTYSSQRRPASAMAASMALACAMPRSANSRTYGHSSSLRTYWLVGPHGRRTM